MRRVRAFWRALRAWLAAKRRAPPPPALSKEVWNPLRLDDEEYLSVMKELDEVLATPVTETPKNSSL
jgi:hypothetical protein